MKYDVKTLNNEGRHDKMTSFIGYINNNVIKLPIYFNSHMRIDEQFITNFLSKFMYSDSTVVHTNINIFELFLVI